jgi:hypothetical protein
MYFPFAKNVGICDLSVCHVDGELPWHIRISGDVWKNQLDVLTRLSQYTSKPAHTEPLVALVEVLSSAKVNRSLYGIFILASSTLSSSVLDQCSISHFGNFTSHTLSLPLEISRSGSKSSSNSPELIITWTVGLALDRTKSA